MPIAFPAIPMPFLPPLYYADIVPGQSPYSSSLKCLLVGQKNSANGIGSYNVPYILSGSKADELFGRGSMLASMYKRARENAPFAEFWGVAMDDSAATASKFTINCVAPTRTGPLTLRIGGQGVSVMVKSTDTANSLAVKVSNAINAGLDLPVTATVAGSAVTLTCKWRGFSGNNIFVEKTWRGAENPLASFVTANAHMGTATGSPSIGGALAGIGGQRFDVFAYGANVTGGTMDAIRDFMDGISGRWSPLQQLHGHWFCGHRADFASSVTFGLTRNDPHASIIPQVGSPSPFWEWAAAVAAHATTHWAEPPELSRPLQTLRMKGIHAPANPANVFTIDEQQSLLSAGMSTWIANDFNEVLIGRLVTTRRMNDWGDPDPSWRDAVTMFQAQYFARRMRQAVTGTFGRAALTTHDSGLPGFASPGAIRDLYIHEYKAMERLGLVENSDIFAASLIVERNETDPNRIDSLIKPDFVNQLRIVANLIETHLELTEADLPSA